MVFLYGNIVVDYINFKVVVKYCCIIKRKLNESYF